MRRALERLPRGYLLQTTEKGMGAADTVGMSNTRSTTGRAPAGRDRTCRPDRREACSGMLLALELVAFQRCGRAVTLVDGLAEAADGAADIRTQAAQALGAEQQHHDQQNDCQLPDTDTHHLVELLGTDLSGRCDCVDPSAGSACHAPYRRAVQLRPAAGTARRCR